MSKPKPKSRLRAKYLVDGARLTPAARVLVQSMRDLEQMTRNLEHVQAECGRQQTELRAWRMAMCEFAGMDPHGWLTFKGLVDDARKRLKER